VNLADVKRFLVGHPTLEEPAFGAGASRPLSDTARRNMRAPMMTGLIIIAVFVLGFGVWATFAPIWGAVIAPGAVRVENNRKTLKTREGGMVRAILVRDGDVVRPNQLLLKLDDTVARAQVQVLSQQHDNLVMQRARFLAEVTNRSAVTIPPELAARTGDPQVAAVISNETLVFSSRLAAIQGQQAILNQRFAQLNTARSGLTIQLQSVDEQIRLFLDELEGYRTLYEKGFAPRTLILRYERQLAEANGRRGALMAEVTQNQQQAGEVRLQLAQLYEQRASEAAAGLREAETRLADVRPRLDAARESLAQTEVRAPEAGYVLNLSQFTVGGVAAPNEPLMDIVPNNAPLVIQARVKPADIDQVRPGMSAQVTLLAYQTSRVPKLEAEVVTVSADALVDQQSGASYFTAELRILPSELKKLPRGVRLSPGMPATASIRTGRRTIMSYLLGPVERIVDGSLKEE
jgi:HlyD family type I secretion membrane fusion protein